ncbi:MAG TPA: methyltransferase domain-containing protein [Candidatus Omnitrophota bacterium]|nr:methyltransferase domain-containing protein [Candidatus Omnitrophota bacterium]HPS21142.1 methyltransferase domain-containing protein [Candidatus Omnitrophota bacterium]
MKWNKLEARFYGKKWDIIHGGYFSDPAKSKYFVGMITAACKKEKPDAVVDLGSGSGFILNEISKRRLGCAPRFIGVDSSEKQLEVCKSRGMGCINASAEKFKRSMAVKKNEKLMLIMRSVLHYMKAKDQPKFFEHLRGQMKKGERFIHQTACFEGRNEVAAMNRCYKLMRTTKTYFTPQDLKKMMAKAGFRTIRCKKTCSVRVESEDLAMRYGLDSDDIKKIIDKVSAMPGGKDIIKRVGDGSFIMNFKYYIFECVAK